MYEYVYEYGKAPPIAYSYTRISLSLRRWDSSDVAQFVMLVVRCFFVDASGQTLYCAQSMRPVKMKLQDTPHENL